MLYRMLSLAGARRRADGAGSTYASYEDAVIASSPIAWYRMNDTGSVLTDSSGSLDGTISASPAPTKGEPTLIDDATNKCLKFNQDGSHAICNNTGAMATLHLGDYSVLFWFMLDQLPTSPLDPDDPLSNYGLVMKEGWHVGLNISNAGKLVATRWHSNDTTSTIVTPSAITLNVPQLACMTVDKTAGKMRLYLNNVLVDSKSFTPGLVGKSNGNPWAIGGGIPGDAVTDYSWPARGWIDEVQFYDRPLLPTEVIDHWNAV